MIHRKTERGAYQREGRQKYRVEGMKDSFKRGVNNLQANAFNVVENLWLNTHRQYERLEYFQKGIMLIKVVKNGKYGVMDVWEKLLVPCEYDDIGNFYDDTADLIIDNEVVGQIDTKGRIV